MKFRNKLVQKAFSGRKIERMELGQTVWHEDIKTLYSRKKIPIVEKSKLSKKYNKYKYNSFYQNPIAKKFSESNKFVFIDIENIGSFYADISNKMITCISFTFYTGETVQLISENIDEEKKLLSKTITIIKNFIVFGWNVEYDMKVIYGRYYIHFGQFPNIINPIIDYIALYRHYIQDKERSFKLDYILKKNGLKGKIEYNENGLNNLYNTNKELYYKYNRRDTEALFELEDKLGVLKICHKIIKITGCLWTDIVYNTRIIDSYMYFYLDRRGLTFIDNDYDDEDDTGTGYEGAFVAKPLIGLHNNVRCYDFSSLYPNIMRTFNISPETYVGQNITGDYYKTVTGACYTKKTGILPLILTTLLDGRKELRKKGDHYGQLAFKILANSFYGAMGSKYFRFYNKYIAESITLTGQQLIKFVAMSMERMYKGVKNIYSDTDSCYLELPKNIDPKEAEKAINDGVVQAWCKYYNVTGQFLNVKDEYERPISGMWFNVKKYYILDFLDGTYKVKGFEKSDSIPIALTIFESIYKGIFEGKIKDTDDLDKIKEIVSKTFDIFKNKNDISFLSFLKPFSINKKLNEYKNRPRFMVGMDTLKKIYPYRGEWFKGLILELTLPPATPRARKRVSTCIAFPEELTEMIPQIVKMLPDCYEINKEKHLKYVYKMIDYFYPILGGKK